MLPLPPLIGCGRNAHFEGDAGLFLFFFLVFSPFCSTLLEDAGPSVMLVLLVLLHVGQAVNGILRQRAKAFGHHPRVGVQDGGQVWFSQLLPVMECQRT